MRDTVNPAMRPATVSRFGVLFVLALCLFPAAPADPHQLIVPFFRDDGGPMIDSVPALGGVAGFVTVRNTEGHTVTMYLVYSQQDPLGNVLMQQAVPFTLAAYQVVNFRPVKDDPVESDGRAVPNVLPGLGGQGSLTIIWIGGPETVSSLVGRYQEVSAGNDMCHVLLPEMLPNE